MQTIAYCAMLAQYHIISFLCDINNLQPLYNTLIAFQVPRHDMLTNEQNPGTANSLSNKDTKLFLIKNFFFYLYCIAHNWIVIPDGSSQVILYIHAGSAVIST